LKEAEVDGTDRGSGGHGQFIVVEGIDGSGTTTLADGLVEYFRAQRRAVHGTCEPSGGPIGALVRQILSRRFVVQTAFGAMAPGWTTMALLFAADRHDHLEAEILPILRDGVMVVSDRYDLSSLAYQSVTARGDEAVEPDAALAWIRDLNRGVHRPDITIVLDVPADVAAQRRRTRGGGKELFEDQELQEKLADAYRSAEKLARGDRIVHIDGTQSCEKVLTCAVAAIAGLGKA
jgi:dTMP kinase